MPTMKQRLVSELKEIGITVAYLAVSLSILQTYKSLILLQQGINAFGNGYLFAIGEAIALGKIVALAQKLPFLKACNRHSLAQAVLYQSAVMTMIVAVGEQLEDILFPKAAKLLAQSGDPMALYVTHLLAGFLIFVFYFTFKGLDESLGPGKLWRLLFGTTDLQRKT
jgi:hypothetical protein